jgi:hypothetical protein
MAIVKILTRHNPSYASLIGYVLRYVVDDKKTDNSDIYTHNLRSNTIEGYVQEFIENEAFRQHTRSDQIFLFHEIVSFHANENKEDITKATIDDLVMEYIRLRGDTGIIVAAPHFDRSHVHIHFCVSALHFRTGKSFGLSNAKLQELKLSFQQYHKQHYPELSKSFPQHTKGTKALTHAQWHVKQRKEITAQVQALFSLSVSQKDFLTKLRDAGLHHYERNGKPTGIEYEGLKFRFSRLLEDKQFEELPIERSEEEKALEAIRDVRAKQQARDDRNRDINEYAR